MHYSHFDIGLPCTIMRGGFWEFPRFCCFAGAGVVLGEQFPQRGLGVGAQLDIIIIITSIISIIIIWYYQASRFLRGDWASGLGSESGFLCQGYPVILYTLTVGVNIIINIILLTLSYAGSYNIELDVCHLKQGRISLWWKQDQTS